MAKFYGWLVVAGTVVAVGCGRDKTMEAAPELAKPDAVESVSAGEDVTTREGVLAFARESLAQGNTNGALQVLEKGLAEPSLADSRPELYRGVLSVMLMQGRVEEVQQRFVKDLETAPGLASPSLGIVRSHLLRQNQSAAVDAWAARLMKLKLTPPVESTVRAWQIQSALQGEEDDPVLVLCRAAVENLPAEQLPAAVGGALRQALQEERLDLASQLLDLLRGSADGSEDLAELVSVFGVELTVRKGMFDEAVDEFQAFSADGSEPASRYLFGLISNTLPQEGARDLLDALCLQMVVITNRSESLRQAATATYLHGARESSDENAYTARGIHLVDRGVPLSFVARPLERELYGAIRNEKTALIRRLSDTLNALAARTDDAETKEGMLGAAIDGYSMSSDYGKALEIIDAGFRGDDPVIATVIAPKLRAHLAEQEGRKLEAISFYRAFMKAAAAHDDLADGGLKLNKVLGLNARRIGRLWSEAGDAEKSAVAYAEAREHYSKALQTGGIRDADRREIEAALKDITERHTTR